MIQALNKLGIEENFHHWTKNIYRKPTAYISLMVRNRTLFLQDQNKKKPLPTPYWSPSQCSKIIKRNQRHTDWEGENKLSVFTDVMIARIEDLNHTKTAGQKVSTERPVNSPHASKEGGESGLRTSRKIQTERRNDCNRQRTEGPGPETRVLAQTRVPTAHLKAQQQGAPAARGHEAEQRVPAHPPRRHMTNRDVSRGQDATEKLPHTHDHQEKTRWDKRGNGDPPCGGRTGHDRWHTKPDARLGRGTQAGSSEGCEYPSAVL